ncbi:GNAT family N-acetyltransferase [Aneurinibacillus sp. Ricciae_BoGa-3]|uniref:GNAT family N-acetyltransferase n=1 Tax=Aneurinibacillus sp. Ricciae_BoGa-3 TaxID=3022697 RepID=UPI00233FA72D|nr:GNAT family N-acetyltransferase [Aneurinibacillus sp. Ricciae_BoGa-3]WCK53393.1 GNAT family N-acetyltransferase [Aneurinibacillus sp. Ricciae_BoGa-3]
MSIIVEILSKIGQMKQANQLISNTWGTGVTANLLMAQSQVGGLIIGAYDNEAMIGVSYGFIASDEFGIFLYSHMLAVEPEYRNKKVGELLKQRQAVEAKARGYRYIKWTFDPLESKNAYINISKLGAVCRVYKENFYGEMDDDLNRGAPTDRLLAEWDVLHSRNEHAASADGAVQGGYSYPVKLAETENGSPILVNWDAVEGNLVAIPIPADIQEIKKQSMDQMLCWRREIRAVLTHYLSRGYTVTGFDRVPGGAVHYYLLERTKASS